MCTRAQGVEALTSVMYDSMYLNTLRATALAKLSLLSMSASAFGSTCSLLSIVIPICATTPLPREQRGMETHREREREEGSERRSSAKGEPTLTIPVQTTPAPRATRAQTLLTETRWTLPLCTPTRFPGFGRIATVLCCRSETCTTTLLVRAGHRARSQGNKERNKQTNSNNNNKKKARPGPVLTWG